MNTRFAAALAASLALGACNMSFSVGNNSSAGSDANESEAATPATRRFVNSLQHARSDALRRHYVDFSFEYPSGWSMTPQPTDGTAQNYVRVAAPLADGYEPFAFHVGYAFGTGNAEADRRAMEAGLPQMAQRLGANFQNYQVVGMGPDEVGGVESLTWRFTATGPAIKNGAPAQIYGRGDIVLPPGASRGVVLISLTTSRTNEVDSPGEVGEIGTLRAVYDSFRLQPGQPAAAKP